MRFRIVDSIDKNDIGKYLQMNATISKLGKQIVLRDGRTYIVVDCEVHEMEVRAGRQWRTVWLLNRIQ